METRFQTSFIPKKAPQSFAPGTIAPAAPRKSGSGRGIYMTIAVVLFIASLVSIAGAYGWKLYLESSQSSLGASLANREKEFNLDQISLMKAESTKIQLARQLINNHAAVSKVFSVISQLTSENIRFVSMDLTVPVGTPGPLALSLAGYGKSFQTVAFQSDVLNHLDRYGLQAVVKNSIVSDPTLNHNGTVSFGFTAQVDPKKFVYSQNLPQQQATTTQR